MAPATLVTSVLVGGALITGALQALAKGGPPTIDLVAGYVLIATAVGATTALAVWARPIDRRLTSTSPTEAGDA